MRLLYLAQRVPYPPTRGDKIPTFHQLRHLSQRHEVTVACLADGPDDLVNVEGLARYVARVEAVPLDAIRARLRALRALVSGQPFTRGYFDEPRLHARVRALVAAERFNAIVVSSSGMAQYVEGVTGVPRVMQFVDLDSQKWGMYAERARRPWSWLYATEAARLLRYERRLAARFERSVVVSEREATDFRRLIPGAAVTCVPNGVDTDAFRPMPEVSPAPHSLVFVGVMDYWPNEMAAVWLCEHLLPAVRRLVPDATVTLCGARPTRRVQALARLPGVTVTGSVPDVRPHLARAEVCVVPLTMARGVQNKILEALAMGMPTVAMRPAFEGLEAREGTHLLVADDADGFIEATVRCLRDPALRARLGLAGRRLVEETYRWEAAVARLESVLAPAR